MPLLSPSRCACAVNGKWRVTKSRHSRGLREGPTVCIAARTDRAPSLIHGEPPPRACCAPALVGPLPRSGGDRREAKKRFFQTNPFALPTRATPCHREACGRPLLSPSARPLRRTPTSLRPCPPPFFLPICQHDAEGRPLLAAPAGRLQTSRPGPQGDGPDLTSVVTRGYTHTDSVSMTATDVASRLLTASRVRRAPAWERGSTATLGMHARGGPEDAATRRHPTQAPDGFEEGVSRQWPS